MTEEANVKLTNNQDSVSSHCSAFAKLIPGDILEISHRDNSQMRIVVRQFISANEIVGRTIASRNSPSDSWLHCIGREGHFTASLEFTYCKLETDESHV